MSWNHFSWKGLTCAALAAMVSPVVAQPDVVAPNKPTVSGTGAGQVYTWSIAVDPDDSLYGPNPDVPAGPIGNSVAIEWTLTSTGLSGAAKNGTNFPNDNPGKENAVVGLGAVAGNSVIANLGSTFLTGAGTFEAVTLTVPGPTTAGSAVGNNHISTVDVSGVYSAVGPPLVTGGTQALIAQGSANHLVAAGKTFQYQVFTGDTNFTPGANPNIPVTATDAQTLVANLNKGPGRNWSTGDFNGDGSVTATDAQALVANLNKDLSAFFLPPPAVAGVVGGSDVPEPGTIVLAGLASIGLIVAVRRNKK